MAKNLMRIYNTQLEYDNELCYIPSDTLSIVIENNKVNYGVNVHEGSGYFVKLDGEKIDIGMKIIPTNYERESIINDVEIGCGINEISSNAFSNSSLLSEITILGNIDTISHYAFSNCYNVSTIKYYGTKEPNYGNRVFYNISVTYVQVTKDYEGEYFCGISVKRVL